ncbi:ICE2-domain-containing protein [Lasiosphaeria ovina]|uniref:ICE2-domain-containing protein n=1 Tax=Lasiosphaeria ovina TaxID=92902 RepID=A0AAE0N7E7_9PEZI|nr:ICE2-domain-containing protein [Lasiosphaeria ovina]
MWWIINAWASAIFLLSIVLSVPIAFDVGGRDAGLAYSLSLFLFYVFYSATKLLTPEKSRVRWFFTTLIGWSQWIVLPALLIWSLNRFSVDAGSTGWVSRNFSQIATRHRPSSWREWFFGEEGFLETVALGGWDNTLSYSSPVFQLLEGFCSLLVIQAAGQITRWLVNRGRSDTWVIILLVFSGSIISSAVYFLWRVARFPQIGNLDATLIGVTMTSAVFLCAFGIGSGRGNPVESSLLFAYIVLCVYQIFTDYQPSAEAAAAAEQAAAMQPDFPPLPPIIMASYSTLLHILGTLPSAVHSSVQFLYAAFQTITPSVIISLTYRIIVFYCATRIIPAVRELGAQAIIEEPSLEDTDGANRLLGFLSWFSPSMLIAVYTSLLLQHFTVSNAGDDVGWTLRAGDAGGSTWRWINIAATMGLYAVELYLGGDGDGGAHWKTD